MLWVVSVCVLTFLSSIPNLKNTESFYNCNPRGNFTVLLSTFTMTSFVSL